MRWVEGALRCSQDVEKESWVRRRRRRLKMAEDMKEDELVEN